MKTSGGMEIQHHAFLTSARDGDDWSASPRGKSPRYPLDRKLFRRNSVGRVLIKSLSKNLTNFVQITTLETLLCIIIKWEFLVCVKYYKILILIIIIIVIIIIIIIILPLGDINTGAWFSGMGVGSGANNPTL
jgi:hypothetical protein